MTAKRFRVSKNGLGKWVIENTFKEGLVVNIPMFLGFDNEESGKFIVEKWNKLADENEELKQREETLLSEIEDFQELLAKNDGVCHKRVIDLIDDRISNFSNVKAELLLNSDDDYRLEKLSFAIQNLRELKKELSK